MKPENSAKLRLIEHLIIQQKAVEGNLFISEFRLPNNKRRVDLVLFTSDRAIAFEIKTGNDNLSRLANQVSDLTQHFDKVIVFCATKHANNAINIIPESTGLWVYSENNIKAIKRGRAKIKNKRQLMEILPEYERKEIKNRGDVIEKIRRKFRKNIELFWKSRSQKTNFDLKDLISISRTPPKKESTKNNNEIWKSIIKNQSSQSSSESTSDNSS